MWENVAKRCCFLLTLWTPAKAQGATESDTKNLKPMVPTSMAVMKEFNWKVNTQYPMWKFLPNSCIWIRKLLYWPVATVAGEVDGKAAVPEKVATPAVTTCAAEAVPAAETSAAGMLTAVAAAVAVAVTAPLAAVAVAGRLQNWLGQER